jgi:short subunit dehydrogenase-like uncharacterized protein
VPKAAAIDIAVYGATGYTGQLVAEYMARQYPAGSGVNWALAGRNAGKLAAVRDAIGAPASTPLITASADDPASLAALAGAAKLVLTTVGPYQLYGSDLVAACAAAGTDYVDLCGEPAWMRAMIDAHQATAERNGARIIFSCGFDSVPFDLGVLKLQEAFIAKYGAPAARVKGRVRKMKGTFSGGTAASLKATMAAAAKNPEVLALLKNPFSLTPGFSGPPQPHGMKPEYDAAEGVWLGPFVMAAINTRNVHRTNALLGHRYGRDFVYDEMVVTGAGDKGEAMAKALAADRSLMREDGPKPGEGPTKAEREAGHYDLLFIGEGAGGASMRVGVLGKQDPGYGSTSKMIAECAVCLLRDGNKAGGGLSTPGAALGLALIDRLEAHAGLTFRVEGLGA